MAFLKVISGTSAVVSGCHGVKTLRTQDTSDLRHFGTGAEVSVRHFGTGAEVSGHFGTEVSLV